MTHSKLSGILEGDQCYGQTASWGVTALARVVIRKASLKRWQLNKDLKEGGGGTLRAPGKEHSAEGQPVQTEALRKVCLDAGRRAKTTQWLEQSGQGESGRRWGRSRGGLWTTGSTVVFCPE